MTPVLLDAGVIVALLDRRERFHAECLNVVTSLRQPLLTCESVVSEACFLLQGIKGASEALLTNIENGAFRIAFDLSRSSSVVGGLMHKYRDIPASLADACLIHMADDFNTGDILTLDSDFLTYRWRKNRAFNMLISTK